MAESVTAAPDATRPADARARRRPAVLALLVVLGAAAAAGAAAMTWWTQVFADSLSGSITTRATGSQTDALLIPVALLALAGFGATLATTGAVRRGVGAVLALGGAGAAVPAVLALFRAPATLKSDLTRPAESAGAAQVHVFGPVLGVVAGVLVAIAGALVLVGFGARKGGRSLGSRYDAPTSARRNPRTGASSDGDERVVPRNAAPRPVVMTPADPANDPNAAAQWWKALDAGEDPTRTRPGGHPDTGMSDEVIRGG